MVNQGFDFRNRDAGRFFKLGRQEWQAVDVGKALQVGNHVNNPFVSHLTIPFPSNIFVRDSDLSRFL